MAKVGLPDFSARCRCGKLLAQDFPGDDSHWTHYAPYVNAIKASAMDLPLMQCPDCGGDPAIPVGNFFGKAFLVAKASHTRMTA